MLKLHFHADEHAASDLAAARRNNFCIPQGNDIIHNSLSDLFDEFQVERAELVILAAYRCILRLNRSMCDNFFHTIKGCLCGCTEDRKSTRLNSSHITISYAVFC